MRFNWRAASIKTAAKTTANVPIDGIYSLGHSHPIVGD
jgi:hypothetical protein